MVDLGRSSLHFILYMGKELLESYRLVRSGGHNTIIRDSKDVEPIDCLHSLCRRALISSYDKCTLTNTYERKQGIRITRNEQDIPRPNR